jgi:hypothetical protein
MIVVLVLTTSCQVSLKPKIGPDKAHTMIDAAATANAPGRPLARATQVAAAQKACVKAFDLTCMAGQIARLPLAWA